MDRRLKFQVGPQKHHLYVRIFQWGIVGHVRWGRVWRHAKIETFCQHNLKVSTRRQRKHGCPRRYVGAVRLHISVWKSSRGEKNIGKCFGVLLYFPRSF